MKTTIIFAGVALTASHCLAGDFINLGFEQPNLSHATISDFPGIQVAPTSEALQGWTLTGIFPPGLDKTYIGGSTPPVAIKQGVDFSRLGLDFGKYELYLDSPSQVPGSFQPIYHLSQLGTIPNGATKLVFYRFGPTASFNPFNILINSQPVPFTEGGIGYADVSGFAGQQVKLEFVFPKGGNDFDITGFTIAPEPSTYALFGLGAALLWWQRRRRSSR